jgi:hypothetical protein
MLCSQFSAIFDNFQRKNWRFSQKLMLRSIKKISFVFGENIYKIIASVPDKNLFALR